jgi:hypothetical protein
MSRPDFGIVDRLFVSVVGSTVLVRPASRIPGRTDEVEDSMSTSYYPDDLQFAGACFAYLGLGSGTATYVRFGSDSSGEIFVDNFEVGDTTAWSSVTP